MYSLKVCGIINEWQTSSNVKEILQQNLFFKVLFKRKVIRTTSSMLLNNTLCRLFLFFNGMGSIAIKQFCKCAVTGFVQ
jgi:hypothetical protein